MCCCSNTRDDDLSYPLSRALIDAFDSASFTRATAARSDATSSAFELACVHEVSSTLEPFIPLLDKWLKVYL